MNIIDRSRLFFKFASPQTIEFEDELLWDGQQYVFAADTDRDIATACCVEATATAVDGRLIFNPAMDNTQFYNKVQQGGARDGNWEIRLVANGLCVASGAAAFAPGVVAPGYTPHPDPARVFYDKEQVDALVADAVGVTEGRVNELIDAAIGGVLGGAYNE